MTTDYSFDRFRRQFLVLLGDRPTAVVHVLPEEAAMLRDRCDICGHLDAVHDTSYITGGIYCQVDYCECER